MENNKAKENMSRLGLELVALAGDARSIYLEILSHAKAKNFSAIEPLMKEAEELIVECHKKQTELLQEEARGNYQDVTMIMVHGQDHLMTTILLKELVDHIVGLYKGK